MADAAPWTPFGAAGDRLPAERGDVTLAAAPTPTAWLLQADYGDAIWREAAAAAAGVGVPGSVGGVRGEAGRRILALGPDMWLLLSDGQPPAPAGLEELEGRFGHASAVEQTEARAWLTLEGAGAADALRRLSTHDLDLAAFPAGTARGAMLGPVACILERLAADRFVIGGPVSTAEFLAELLLDALPNAA